MAEGFRPPCEMNFEGNINEEWKKWKQKFHLFMEATEKNAKPERQKVAMFLNLIGEQGLDIYNTFSTTETTETLELVMKHFDEYCQPKKNLTYERHKFFSSFQKENQTIDAFVTELKKLASTCEFSDQTESLIKDRLILGIRDKHLKEKLLREPQLQLQRAVDYCRANEISKKQLHEISDKRINVIKQDRWQVKNKIINPKKQWRSSNDLERQCQRCGLTHRPRSCPAWGKKCRKCQKPNHFAKLCKTVQTMAIKTETEEPQEDDNFVLAVNTEQNKVRAIEWKEQVEIIGHQVTFKLDTGADVNILPFEEIRKLKAQELLKPTSKIITSYSGHPIELEGICKLPCKTKSHVVQELDFFVIKENLQPILGLEAMQKLQLAKRIFTAQTGSEVNEAQKIIERYEDVFTGMGKLRNEYHIKLKEGAIPQIAYTRRLSLALRDDVKKELEKMIEEDTIKKCDEPSDWIHPIVVARKPNGKVRICIDPRKLNEYIAKEQFPIPTFESIVSELTRCQIFTVLDARAAYWQIPLDAESAKLCTFTTPFGRYMFNRLPYGLSSAAEVFQKTMSELTEGLPGVKVYMDDFIIYGKDMQEHNLRLERLLQRFRQCNLKLTREKIQLAQEKVTFMGHLISKEGILPKQTRIEAIKKMKPPENKKELQRFLGMTNYLSRFIPNYSEKTKELRALLSAKNEWIWDETEQQCFDHLKLIITESPVLAFYDPKKQTVLSTDASQGGLGAVLLQDGQPIAYASTSLTKCQQQYSQIEKELLAIVVGCEKFNYYLYGTHFVVETDHKPLLNLINKPMEDMSPRLQRLVMKLSRYDLKMQFVPGKYMYISDLLSRSPLPQETYDTSYLENKAQAVQAVVCITDESLIEIQEETSRDDVLQELIRLSRDGWPKHKSLMTGEVKKYWDSKEEIHEADDLVFRGQRIIIPQSLKNSVLKKIHAAHQGIASCKRRAKDAIYWPGMNKDIELFVQRCDICQRFGRSNLREPLKQHDIPSLPWDKLGIDIMNCDKETYLLVVDYHSKFAEVRKLNKTHFQSVIAALKSIFQTHGLPSMILTDNGPPFEGHKFNQFCHDCQITHTTSSPRYPRSNGMVERTKQTIKNLIKKVKQDGKSPDTAILEYNATPKENLPSPAEMLMGRKLRASVPQNAKLRRPKYPIQETVQLLLQNQKKQKLYADRGTKLQTPLTENQPVMIQTPTKTWTPGKIVSKDTNPRSFRVKTPAGKTLRRNRFHLKKRLT